MKSYRQTEPPCIDDDAMLLLDSDDAVVATVMLYHCLPPLYSF